MIWLFVVLVLIALAVKMASLIATASLRALCAKASVLIALAAVVVWAERRLRPWRGVKQFVSR